LVIEPHGDETATAGMLFRPPENPML
jgi:hypothetical protein